MHHADAHSVVDLLAFTELSYSAVNHTQSLDPGLKVMQELGIRLRAYSHWSRYSVICCAYCIDIHTCIDISSYTVYRTCILYLIFIYMQYICCILFMSMYRCIDVQMYRCIDVQMYRCIDV